MMEADDRQIESRLSEFLLRIYHAGTVEFRTWLPPIARAVSERPVASPVARWQARHGLFVTSLFHIAVKVEDEIGRSLLSWMDGTVDHGGLLERIEQLLVSRDALILVDGDASAVRRKLAGELEANLAKLTRLGLLVG